MLQLPVVANSVNLQPVVDALPHVGDVNLGCQLMLLLISIINFQNIYIYVRNVNMHLLYAFSVKQKFNIQHV